MTYQTSEIEETKVAFVNKKASVNWTNFQKISFRIAFIFFGLFSIPLDFGFYKLLVHIDWLHVNYRELTEIFAFYNPQIINHYSEGGFFGWESYINFVFIFAIAVAGGAAWTVLDKKSTNYSLLYYWVRTLARYRVAYGIISWGFKKVFVMQMPPHNVGILHTDFIDFFAKRLYWEHVSVSTSYTIFLGFAEVIPGIMMLFRKTNTLGAALSAVVLANIAIANHAYDIGEHIPCGSMAMLALFVLWYDLPAIYRLLIKEEDSQISRYYPPFSVKWQFYTKQAVKHSFTFVFVFLFFALEVKAKLENDNYKIPNTPGLKGARGHYNVTEFRINNKVVPYDPADSVRWHDATFEEWSSLSFRVANRPSEIEMNAAANYPRRGEPYDYKWHFNIAGDERRFPKKHEEKDPSKRDLRIKWELSGLGSERKWYYYKEDKEKQILYLQNKNKFESHLKQVLHYSRPSESRIVLTGTNELNDSIYVVLDRSNKTYPLLEGRKEVISSLP